MGKLPVRAVLVFCLFVLSAIGYLDRTNLSIAGPQIMREYGLNDIRLGWMMSAFLLGYAGAQLLAGWAAVRLGPRRALAIGALWWGVFTAGTALVPTRLGSALSLLIAIRFALGIGEAIVYPASNQFVAQWIPTGERGRVNGVIFAGVGAGAGLTPPLLTEMIAKYGWRSAFWFSAVLGVLAGLVWFRMARDTPKEHPRMSAEELGTIRMGLASQPLRTPVPWASIARSRTVVLLTFSSFCFGYMAWIFLGWFYLYMAEARGVDLKTSALYAMLPFLAMTTFCLAGGVLNDWMTAHFGLHAGRCGPGWFALLVGAAFLVLGSRAASAPAAAMILALGAGALYLSQSSYWSVTADIAGPHAGVVSAVMNMGGQIGSAVTASMTPWLASRFGWTTSFLAAAVFGVAGAVAWFGIDPGKKIGVRDERPWHS